MDVEMDVETHHRVPVDPNVLEGIEGRVRAGEVERHEIIRRNAPRRQRIVLALALGVRDVELRLVLARQVREPLQKARIVVELDDHADRVRTRGARLGSRGELDKRSDRGVLVLNRLANNDELASVRASVLHHGNLWMTWTGGLAV